MSKIIEYIKHPSYILLKLDEMNIIRLNDRHFLSMKYKKVMKRKLNLDNPETLNEKLQWLKLYDRNPEYTKMVDKYEVKQYVANLIGEEYIIPTIGIYDKFEDIDFNKLPNQFVMKCTHDSGSTIICKNKEEFDKTEAKKKINKALRKNFYYSFREWPYKNVKPRIIIEKYMCNNDGTDILDYKFYCFHGISEYVLTCTDRQNGNTKYYYYDKNWNFKRNMTNDGMKADKNFNIEKPKNIDKMFEVANKLSNKMKFIRVDLYDINGKIYFGELTLFPSGGFDKNRRKETDEIMSSKLKLN